MLQVEDLHKAYGATQALAGVDLRCRGARSSACSGPTARARRRWSRSSPGCAGPTGAGSGSPGSTRSGRPQRVRQLVGLAPQDTGVYPTLTVRDNLRFFAGLAGMRRSEARTRADEVGAALGLEELFDRRARAAVGWRAPPPPYRDRARAPARAGAARRADDGCRRPHTRPDPRVGSEPRRSRLGGRLLDALPARDRGARRERRVHRPWPDRRARHASASSWRGSGRVRSS